MIDFSDHPQGYTKAEQTTHRRIKGERVLDLPDYRRWLKEVYPGEPHHYLTRSDIGQNDFFIVMISTEEHRDIHAVGGRTGVKGFVKERGLNQLTNNSADTLNMYCMEVRPEGLELYMRAIERAREDPCMAIEITRELATELKERGL